MVQPERSARAKHNAVRSTKHSAGVHKAIEQYASKRIKALAITYDDGTVNTQTLDEHEHWSAKVNGNDGHLVFHKSRHPTIIQSLPMLESPHAMPRRVGGTLIGLKSEHTTSPVPRSRRSPVDTMDESGQSAAISKRKVDSAVVSESDNDTVDTLDVTIVHAKHCRIDDAEGVENFLRECLKNLQQLVVKAIAKAWIKGICPKKQARFPYRSNRHTKSDAPVGPAVIPPWWPIDICPFIEPDHINKDARLNLCVHLLRLRSTPEQLAAWNNDTAEVRNTHRTQGWTEFLEELAGESVVCAVGGPSDKEDKRKELLSKLYYVAKLEQRFLLDEEDGDTIFSWTPEPTKRAAVKKAKHSSGSTTDSETEGSEVMRTSGLPSRRRPTRVPDAVQQSIATLPVSKIERDDETAMEAKPVIIPRIDAVPGGSHSGRARRQPVTRRRQITDASHVKYRESDQIPRQVHASPPNRGLPQTVQPVNWHDQISPADSFASSYHMSDQQGTPISFDGVPEAHYQHAPEYLHQSVDVKQQMPITQQAYAGNMVHHVPQPHFTDTVPNTPILSEPGFMGNFASHMPTPHLQHGMEPHGLPALSHPPAAAMPGSNQMHGFQYQQQPQQYIHHDPQVYHQIPAPHYHEQHHFRPDIGVRPHDLHQVHMEMGHPQQYTQYAVMDPHQHGPGISQYCVDINGPIV